MVARTHVEQSGSCGFRSDDGTFYRVTSEPHGLAVEVAVAVAIAIAFLCMGDTCAVLLYAASTDTSLAIYVEASESTNQPLPRYARLSASASLKSHMCSM